MVSSVNKYKTLQIRYIETISHGSNCQETVTTFIKTPKILTKVNSEVTNKEMGIFWC